MLDSSQSFAVLLILYSTLPSHGSLQTYVTCHSHGGTRDLAQNFVLQLQGSQGLILKLHIFHTISIFNTKSLGEKYKKGRAFKFTFANVLTKIATLGKHRDAHISQVRTHRSIYTTKVNETTLRVSTKVIICMQDLYYHVACRSSSTS